MSNQQYRNEEQEGPTRAERLKAARAEIARLSALHEDASEKLTRYVYTEYKLRGGDTVDSQIEGMLLVIEEGKIYRNQALDYDHAMKQFMAGKLERQPREPGRAAISGATMVSASRQLEVLRERKDRMLEDAEIVIGERTMMMMARQSKNAKTPSPEPTEPQPTKQPQVDKEATPPKEGKRAATAAA
jgi:hypothetical protein